MTTICEYGCEQTATNQLKNKKWCCSKNTSGCPAVKKKSSIALLKAYREGRGGYEYSALSEDTKLKMSGKGQVCLSKEEVFVDGKEWSSELLRKYIHFYKVYEYKCSDKDCNITDWHGEHLVLELDHKNGKRADNREENLRWLCPNCHSQTETFRGRNKNPGKKKVTDAVLLTALREHVNIRQALQSVGLAAKGGNCERATKLFNKINALVME